MTIEEMLDNIRQGEAFEILLKVVLGETDKHALDALGKLYNAVPEKTSYATVSRILEEMMWWHITFNTLVRKAFICNQWIL